MLGKQGIKIRQGEKGKLWYAWKEGDNVLASGETEQEAINNSIKILEEQKNAVQEPETKEVFPRQQEEVGETGGEREGMEQKLKNSLYYIKILYYN